MGVDVVNRLDKLEIEDDVHKRAADMLSEIQVTLELVSCSPVYTWSNNRSSDTRSSRVMMPRRRQFGF